MSKTITQPDSTISPPISTSFKLSASRIAGISAFAFAVGVVVANIAMVGALVFL